MVAQPNESTVNLDSTQEEMEVLVLDQDLGDVEPELEERMDTAPPPATQEQDDAKEKEGKAGKGQKRT